MLGILEAFKLEIEETLKLETYYDIVDYGLKTSEKSTLIILNPFIDETYKLTINEQSISLRTITRCKEKMGILSYDICDPKCIDNIIIKLKEWCDAYCEFKK